MYLLSKVVKQHDVGIHVIQIITIWRISFTGPGIWARTLVREHVATMFGLIINTVKAGYLAEEICRNNYSE